MTVGNDTKINQWLSIDNIKVCRHYNSKILMKINDNYRY